MMSLKAQKARRAATLGFFVADVIDQTMRFQKCDRT
jgi:hypothetical protein